MLRRVASSLLLVVSCATLGRAQEAERLRFAWPVPSTFVVVERAEKNSERAAMRHHVRLEAAGTDSDELRLRFERTETLEAAEPDLDRAFRLVVGELGMAYPDLRISRSGQLLGVVDWEGYIERCVELVRQLGGEAAASHRLQQLRTTLTSPRFSTMLQAKVAEFWRCWVAVWLDVSPRPGWIAEALSEIPIGATLVDAPTRLANEGPVEGGVRLTCAITLGGEEARRAFSALLAGMAPPGSPAPPVERFTRRTSIEAVTQLESLRPSRVLYEIVSDIEVKGEPKNHRVDRRTWEFEWTVDKR